MAKEDLLVNLELDAKGFKKSLDETSKALASNDKQAKQLEAEIRKLEEAFNGTQSQTKAMNKELARNAKAIAEVGETYKETSRQVEVLNNNFTLITGALKKTADSFMRMVEVTSSLVNIFSQLTDPQLLNKMSKVAFILSTIAGVRGFPVISGQLKELSKTLEEGAAFFVRFNQGGDLSLEAMLKKAQMLETLTSALKFAATSIAGFALIGLITGLNDVLFEFGLMSKTVSKSLVKLPIAIQNVAIPLAQFGSVLQKGAGHIKLLANEFVLVATGGKTFTAFLKEVTTDFKSIRGMADSVGKSLSNLGGIAAASFESMQKPFKKVALLTRLFSKAATESVNSFHQEFYRTILKRKDPYVAFEIMSQTIQERLSRSFKTFLTSDFSKTLRGMVLEFNVPLIHMTHAWNMFNFHLSVTAKDSIAKVVAIYTAGMGAAITSMGQGFLRMFPIIGTLGKELSRFGVFMSPVVEQVTSGGKEIIQVLADVSRVAKMFASDIFKAFGTLSKTGGLANIGQVLSYSFKSGFQGITSLAAITVEGIAEVFTTRGPELGQILRGMGDIASQNWSKTMDHLIVSAASFEVNVTSIFKKVVDTTLRGSKAFANGFAVGFSIPIVTAISGMKALGGAAAKMTPSLFTLVEAGHLTGPILMSLGLHAFNSESAFVKLGGAIIFVASVAMAGLATAMLFLSSAIGGFMVKVGDGLLNLMTEFEQKFQKAQMVTSAFAFTLTNFSNALGSNLVGSLDTWNAKVGELVKSTQFGVNEIQKGIQLLVAESQVVGLTLNQSEKLLSRATDLASAKGLDLAEVVDRLIAGISGQGQAVRAMGINLSEHHIEHSKYLKAMEAEGIVVDETAMNLIRFNETMAQSVPFAGFAAQAITTVAGANAMLEKSIMNVQVALGEQSSFTVAYVVTLKKLADIFLQLPSAIIDTVGVLIDFGGVTLKILGTLLQYVLVLTSLTTVLGLLNAGIVKSLFTQTLLTNLSMKAAVALNIKTVAVVNLSTALGNMARIMLGVVVKSMASMGMVLLGLAKSMTTFTASLLANPLFWKGAAIVAIVFALIEAFQQLQKMLKTVGETTKETGEQTTILADALQSLADFFSKIFQALVNVSKLALIGIMKLYGVVQILAIGLRKLVSYIPGFGKLTGTSDEIREKFIQVADVMGLLDDEVLRINGSGTAMAKSLTDEFEGLEKKIGLVTTAARGFSDALKLSKEVSQDLKIDILGDEFDKASKKVDETAQALDRLRNIGIIKLGTEFLQPTTANLAQLAEGTLKKDGKRAIITPASPDDLLKAGIDAEKAKLEVLKIRKDSLKDFAKIESDLSFKLLENTNKEVEAIKARGALELAEFSNKIARNSTLGSYTAKELGMIQRIKEGLAAVTAEEAKRKQQAIDSGIAEKLKKELEDLAKIRNELQILNKENFEGQGDLAAVARIDYEIQLNKIDALRESLLVQKEFLDDAGYLREEYEAIFDRADKMAGLRLKEGLAVPSSAAALSKDLAGADMETLGGRIAQGFLTGTLTMADQLGKLFSGDIDFAKMANNLFEGLSASDLLEGLESGISSLLSFSQSIFDPAAVNGLADQFSFLADLPDELLKAFENLGSMIEKFLTKLPEAMSRLLDKLPALITKIVEKIPEIVNMIVGAVSKLIEMLPSIFSKILEAAPAMTAMITDLVIKVVDMLPAIVDTFLESIPATLEAFLSRLPELIVSILNAIGDIIKSVFKNLPNILVTIMEAIPDIIEAIIIGVVEAMGTIAGAFVDFLLNGGLEKIFVAFMKMVPRIVIAIGRGIIKAIQSALGSIFGGKSLKIPKELEDLPGKFQKGVADLGKAATNEASKLFKVLDLEAQAQGITNAKSIEDSFILGMDIMEKKFTNWMDELRKIWYWVYDNLINPFGPMIQKAFQWVSDNVITPIAEAVQKAWQWVIDNVITPIANAVQVAFQWVIDNVITPIANAVQVAFQWVLDNIINPVAKLGTDIWNGFKAGLDGLGDFFSKLGTDIWNGFNVGLEGLGDFFTKMFNDLDPSNLFSKIFSIPDSAWDKNKSNSPVETALGINIPFAKFAQGGMVPGSALVAGDSLLNDRILAMLSPGEAVIPRSKMEDPQIASLVRSILEGDINPPQFALGGVLGKALDQVIKVGSGALSGAGKTLSGASSVTLGAASKALKDAGGIASMVDPSKLWAIAREKAFEVVMKAFEANKFHNGGLVPAFAGGGEVPSMLQSGEFVINRMATKALGLGALNGLNQGAAGSQVFNFDVKMNIESNGVPDESFIRQRLIPTMKKELKDASLRGEFLISEKGIRKT